MEELSTYELVHFIPFTAEVYDRQFVLHNEEFWPAHVLAIVAAIVVFVAAAKSRERWAAATLSLAWMSVGVGFFGRRLAELLWMSPWVGVLFVVQAVLIAVAAHRRSFELARPRLAASASAFAVVSWALLTPLFGRPWSGVEVFGLTPDPTALATLFVLSGATSRAWFLWPIPVLWCVVSALGSYALASA